MADNPQRYVTKFEFYSLLGSTWLGLSVISNVVGIGQEKVVYQIAGIVIGLLFLGGSVMFMFQASRERKRLERPPGKPD
jgi:hypothetical protein